MISNIVGNTVQGDDFFDRERELESVLDRLETNNVLLLAPRRVGKTSLMYRIQEKEKELGRLAAYLSVADVNSELQFVQKLYEAAQRWSLGKRAIEKLAGGPLGRFMKRIKKLGVAVVSIELADNAADQWAELGAALARVLDTLDQRCVFLVDELPIFVLSLLRQEPTGARARTFLNWFRQLRQDPESSRRVRWLLAGIHRPQHRHPAPPPRRHHQRPLPLQRASAPSLRRSRTRSSPSWAGATASTSPPA